MREELPPVKRREILVHPVHLFPQHPTDIRLLHRQNRICTHPQQRRLSRRLEAVEVEPQPYRRLDRLDHRRQRPPRHGIRVRMEAPLDDAEVLRRPPTRFQQVQAEVENVPLDAAQLRHDPQRPSAQGMYFGRGRRRRPPARSPARARAPSPPAALPGATGRRRNTPASTAACRGTAARPPAPPPPRTARTARRSGRTSSPARSACRNRD